MKSQSWVLTVCFFALSFTAWILVTNTDPDEEEIPNTIVDRKRLLESDVATLEVAKELISFYENPAVGRKWKQALDRLSSTEIAERDEASNYIRRIVSEALNQERSGLAPWRGNPFWDTNAKNPARILRGRMIELVKILASTESSLTIIEWYLEVEPVAAFQIEAQCALSKIEVQKADDLLLQIVNKPHANPIVVTASIKEIEKRNIPITRETVKALCHHHRKSIRMAARKLNKARNFPEVKAFNPVRSVQQLAIRNLMRDISKLILEPIPAEARVVRSTVTTIIPGQADIYHQVTDGWVIEEDGRELVVSTPHGWNESEVIKKRDKPWADSYGTYTLTIEHLSNDELVKRIEAARRESNTAITSSKEGCSTSQPERYSVGLHEVLLGHWLYQSKRYDLAARILLPSLDMLSLDSELVEIVKRQFGKKYGYQMIAAFVGDRDYQRAEQLANFLQQEFDETMFHGYAVSLSKQLPRRKDDFKTLKLPTSEEWTTLKATLSRREQIDFLCQRMQLLNCFQNAQPGGISYYSQQYREAGGIDHDASSGGYDGKTEVINPLIELNGERFYVSDNKKPTGLLLTVADIPQIASHLREEWFILGVSFWRSFHPSRTLHTTRDVFCMLIHDLAKQDLFDAKPLDKMNKKEIEKQIVDLIQWSKQHSGMKESDLLYNALEKSLVQSRWHEVQGRANRLAELNDRRAIPIARRFLDMDSVNEYNLADILRYCRQIDPQAVTDLGRKYANHSEHAVRIQAAIILLKSGNANQARSILGQVLPKVDRWNTITEHVRDAVDALFDEGAEESKQTAGDVRVKGIHLCVESGPT